MKKKQVLGNEITNNQKTRQTTCLVYVTSKGKKYHVKTFRTLKKFKIINEMTLEKAINKGYDAFKVCEPGNYANSLLH